MDNHNTNNLSFMCDRDFKDLDGNVMDKENLEIEYIDDHGIFIGLVSFFTGCNYCVRGHCNNVDYIERKNISTGEMEQINWQEISSSLEFEGDYGQYSFVSSILSDLAEKITSYKENNAKTSKLIFFYELPIIIISYKSNGKKIFKSDLKFIFADEKHADVIEFKINKVF